MRLAGRLAAHLHSPPVRGSADSGTRVDAANAGRRSSRLIDRRPRSHGAYYLNELPLHPGSVLGAEQDTPARRVADQVAPGSSRCEGAVNLPKASDMRGLNFALDVGIDDRDAHRSPVTFDVDP